MLPVSCRIFVCYRKNSVTLIYLELKQVSKSYGEKVLFDRLDLPVNKGQKVALVAKNGSGKSTLLRIAAGVDRPEGLGAEVYVHRDARLGYLPQNPDFGDNQTVMEAVFESDNPKIKAVENYERALLIPERTQSVQQAVARMDELRAWDFEARIKEILTKLNITDFEQRIGTLSGGQQKRLALAKMVIEDPDLIILDEPTNHLDLDMIEWLETYLQQPNLTLLMVTHDRYFLEEVCDQIAELDRGELFRYSGNYSEFLESKAIRQEIEAATHDKNRKLMKRELDWVRRMPKARGTKAKSRVDAFYELKEEVGGFREEDELQIDIKGQRLGKKILEAHHISKRFGDKVIIDGFSYKFKKGERVGVVGPNGAGKTTFLELLTQGLKPDQGKVVVGGNTVFGYYTQDGIALPEDKRVIDVVRDIAEYIPLEKGKKLTAPGLLERFLFSRAQQQVFVSQLSGGEKRRLYLLTVLMENPNFLILDEPTNDLDLVTLNVLEDFLLEFPGCILIVSHDRFFLNKICDHLFILESGGRVRDYNGTYTEYRAEQREREEAARQAPQSPSAAATTTSPPSDSGAISYEERKQIKRIENQIQKLEQRKTDLTAQFDNPDLSPERITELAKELAEIKEQIEAKELEWMELVG